MKKIKFESDLWFDFLESEPMTPQDEKTIQEFLAKSKALRETNAKRNSDKKRNGRAAPKPKKKEKAV